MLTAPRSQVVLGNAMAEAVVLPIFAKRCARALRQRSCADQCVPKCNLGTRRCGNTSHTTSYHLIPVRHTSPPTPHTHHTLIFFAHGAHHFRFFHDFRRSTRLPRLPRLSLCDVAAIHLSYA